MSHREFLIVLTHAHVCSACRGKLLANPGPTLASRPLSEIERERLTGLKDEDFITPDALARAAGVSPDDLNAYQDEAVVRLRHL
jgi:hypothetical protein